MPFSLFGLLLLPIMAVFGLWELVGWTIQRDKRLGDAAGWLVAVMYFTLHFAGIVVLLFWVSGVASGWVTAAVIGAAVATVPLWNRLNRQDASHN
jgi:hypothetical protein